MGYVVPAQSSATFLRSTFALVLALLLAACSVEWGYAAGTATAGYVLGPEDVLEITVWGYPDLTVVVSVRPDGKATAPLAGTVQAGGRSIEQVAEDLTRAYATYIINPQVTVIVKEFRKIRVSILGQVAHPGTYAMPPNSRLLDALSAAGGMTDVADLKNARLLAPVGTPRVMDLQRALAGDLVANVFLHGGETLVVPEDLASVVSIIGEVAHPGRYRLKGEMHVLDALVAAGGLTDRASLTQARVVRASRKSEPLHLDGLLLQQEMNYDAALQPGDTLVIPEETNNKIFVIGDVNHPGIYPLKGEITLLQALAMAGGPVQRAFATAKNAYVVRRVDPSRPSIAADIRGGAVQPLANNNGVLISVDLAKLMQGQTPADAVQPGDVVVVREAGINGLGVILNMLSTIFLGIRP